MQSGARQLIRFLFLTVLAAFSGWTVRAEPTLTVLSALTWTEDADWFGGLSGAEISPDGTMLTVVTDFGWLLTARLTRQNDALTAVKLVSSTRLKFATGRNLDGEARDAEGLAIALDGQAFVSFEHLHRVARLTPQDGRTEALSGNGIFGALSDNGGLEALAVDQNGRLLAIPETSALRQTPFPIYFREGRFWRAGPEIPRRGPFLPVGADVDAGGRLYLLERAVTPLGFRSRVRRFDLAAPDLAEVTLLTSLPGQYDNLEAITIWSGPDGKGRVTLVSDDNFLAAQKTQIVEFAVDE